MPLSVASFENAFFHFIGWFLFVCLFVFYGFSAPERSPGEANGNPLQYSLLENFMDRGCSPWSCKESDTTEQVTLCCGEVCKFD